MSRRFDSRLKCQLPLTLTSNGDVPFNGVVFDISQTYFRAQFANPISTHKPYRFNLVLPSNIQIGGKTKVNRAYPKHSDGRYTYVFMIESIPEDEEKTLLKCIESSDSQDFSERRRGTIRADYRKNRRFSDRDSLRFGKPRVVITGIGVV